MNLDAKINEIGYKIVDKIKTEKKKDLTKYKNYIDKVLGVLANDGVYAYWVYCKANKITDVFVDTIIQDKEIKKFLPDKKENELIFQKLSEKFDGLLFFKELIEKALIYARYHAKALKDE